MIIMLFLWSEWVCFMTEPEHKGNTVPVIDRPVSMAIRVIKNTFIPHQILSAWLYCYKLIDTVCWHH